MSGLAETIDTERNFKTAVRDLRALTQDDLEAVNDVIMDRMQSSVPMIPEVAGHLINAGGKRLRPVLTLAAARALDYRGDNHLDLAAAVELIHGATLLHDDVVDDSALRRGLKTANIIWGNKESVLVGDFLFSRAFELMVRTGSLKVLDILSTASCTIAEGEVLQLTTQKNTEATFEMYLDVVKAKTAALFAAATHAGAVIAGADAEQEEAFRAYGMNFGIAYQLVDDALDYAGSQSDLGKSVGDDFREGKMTLPVVYALEMARDEEERNFWHRTIREADQTEADLPRALRLMQRDDIIGKTLDCARHYADLALKNIRTLPNSSYTRALAELVDQSVERIA